MLRQEFEQRTGFFPSEDMYEVINMRYNESDMDKDDFCRMYLKNEDGIAESIQREATEKAWKYGRIKQKEIQERDQQIISLKKEIARLNKQLEELEGWKPYEVSKMQESDYIKLAEAGVEWNSTKCEDYLVEEFGFDRTKIKVLCMIPEYQKSEDGRIRKTGRRDRRPIWSANDWNYIRFDVNNWQYEVVNGSIYHYED